MTGKQVVPSMWQQVPSSGPMLVAGDIGDMTEVLTSLCARLYGRRSARTRANRALRGAAQPVGGQ
jgi:hypothetical protein